MTGVVAKKGNKWSSAFWIIVLTGMASLVVMVAVLQYRWTKQLIEATASDMGNSLRPLTIGWHLDFYGELSAICVALQVGPDSGAHDGWSDYLQRYTEWSRQDAASYSPDTSNANPDLVEDVFIWETSDNRPKLRRLIPGEQKIVLSETPARLEQLLDRLQKSSATLPQALRAWQQPGASWQKPSTKLRTLSSLGLPRWSGAMIGWQFDENIPAVVHPLLHHVRPLDSQSRVRDGGVDWIVVVLNRNTIQYRIIPNLMKRYFAGSQGLEYKLAIVEDGKVRHIIYSSDSDFPSGDAADLDSQLNIFGPSPGLGEVHDWHIAKNYPVGRGNSFSGLVWFPVIQYGDQDAPWMLLLQHRTTPLQAIAGDIWRRNILTGGVVLLLLTIDMCLIVVASRRAHNLARLQLNFVASVSHELLTPLSAIYCTGQNAQDGLLQRTSEVIEHGSIITSQSRQLIELVKDILLFASTNGSPNRYVLRPISVNEIVDSVRRDVAVLIEDGGFTLEEQLEPYLPHVMGDLRAITHCLQNLITNAMKYSGQSRWIAISASLHPSGTNDEEVRISVHDHGVGIPESDLQHIFEPFYRGKKSVDAQIHGTGLGLAVAKRIAEAMGGKLSVKSPDGIGSRFTLHLMVDRRPHSKIERQPEFSQVSS
jgi:signal transduction histidine kinase